MTSSNSSNFSKGWTKQGNSCTICWKNEILDSNGVEIRWNFLETLNLVWPCLEEALEENEEEKTKRQNDSQDGFKGGRFTEIPPMCQLCADRIQAVQYFKSLSDRYLEKIRKSMEEAKAKEGANGASSLSSKLIDNETSKSSVETQHKLDIDIPKPTLKLPWKPNFLKNTSPPASSPVSMEILQIERTARGILNKLTNNGSNFDILTSQLLTILPFLKNQQDDNPDNQLIMTNVASLIFNKAVEEAFYCPAYVRLTSAICKLSCEFRKSILDQYQSQFQHICVEESSEKGGDEDKRQKCFGIVNFIQELFNVKFKLVTPRTIVACVDILVQPPINQLKLECVYNFLATEKHEENIAFGQLFEIQLKTLTDAVKRGEKVKYFPVDGWMDKIFEKLTEFSRNSKFSGRIRCLLENLVELRENEWKKKDINSETAKVTEVSWGKAVLKPFPPYDQPAQLMLLLERNARSILNKVNLNNVDLNSDNLFIRLFFKFLKSPFWSSEDEKIEQQIVKAGEMLFEKGVKEPMYSNAYAKIVQEISRYRRKYPYSRNFEKIKEIVVNRCIDEISKIGSDAHADLLEGEKILGRERVLDVIKFIGELYNLEVFSARNMGTCMQLLINGCVNEVKVECMYKLLMSKFFAVEIRQMVYYGEFLDTQLIVFGGAGEEDDEDVRWIDGMFWNMGSFAEDLRFGGRIRCLLMNLKELRGNGWKDKGQGIGSIAVFMENNGKKNGEGRGRGVRKVPDGNWRN